MPSLTRWFSLFKSNHSDPPFKFNRPHPIHSLPYELLVLIFTSASRHDHRCPIAISHVSRTWRYIALNTPALWRRILLSPNNYIWNTRILRARACSLDVLLIHPTHGSVHSCIQLALSEAHRWRSLHIKLNSPYPQHAAAALTGSSTSTPLLEELSLVYPTNDDSTPFILFIANAPRLRRLTLDGIRITWYPSLFANLTTLDYTHHGFTAGHDAVHEVRTLLTVSKHLRDLRLFFPPKHTLPFPSTAHPFSYPYPHTAFLTLSHLTHLTLRSQGREIPFELAQLATILRTPLLTTFCLADPSRGQLPFANLKAFFYVFAIPRTLRDLRIEHGWYDARMLAPLVQSLPCVHKIVVRRLYMPDKVLNVDNARPAMHKTRI